MCGRQATLWMFRKVFGYTNNLLADYPKSTLNHHIQAQLHHPLSPQDLHFESKQIEDGPSKGKFVGQVSIPHLGLLNIVGTFITILI